LLSKKDYPTLKDAVRHIRKLGVIKKSATVVETPDYYRFK